ncbi:MAG: hypothetical protein U1E11_00820 [Dethiobacteria bacterium]|nr:hypothetical protein [Dethiobacteria bacterium]
MEDCFESSAPVDPINRSLEELLRTPAVKDRAMANLSYLEPEKARELARVLFWSDSAFSFGLLGQLPRGLNFVVALLDETGRQLQKVPPLLLKEFSAEMLRTLDTDAIKALYPTYSPLLTNLGLTPGNNPEAIERLQEKKIRFLQDRLRSADFGKIRHKVTRHIDENYPVIESVVNTIISDPVIFANLLNILPPLLNNLLKGAASALENIDFPPEILASSVFNQLDDIRAEELGAIANQLNCLINRLHEGSSTLGGNEPRFRPVLKNLFEKTVQNLDAKEASGALLALSEDLEVVFYVAADTALQEPELAAGLLSAMLQGSSAVLRGLTYLADQIGDLPLGLMNGAAGELAEDHYKEFAKLINTLVNLSNKVLADHPDLVEKVLHSFYQSLDREALFTLLQALMQQGAAFATSEELAKAINSGLDNYNRKLESSPDFISERLTPCLDHLDCQKLDRALRLTAGQIAETLAGQPGLSRSIIRTYIKILCGTLRGSLKISRKEKRGQQ